MCVLGENGVVCFIGVFFFFQAEDGIRDYKVTGVQTCALPISAISVAPGGGAGGAGAGGGLDANSSVRRAGGVAQVGRAACRGRGEISVGAGALKKKKNEEGGQSEAVEDGDWNNRRRHVKRGKI